jgi:hypothetical protein
MNEVTESMALLFAAGAAGALIKDLLIDGCIELPKKIDSKFSLGFISSMVIGAFAGYFVDGNYVTAFLAGVSGSLVMNNLIAGKKIVKDENMETEITTTTTTTTTTPPSKEEIEKIIRAICKAEGVDENLAVKVAKCESGLNCLAINVNTTGSKDRGIFQWNDKYHPDITDEMAFNPITATKLFCKAVREGHIDWWNASKKCWG